MTRLAACPKDDDLAEKAWRAITKPFSMMSEREIRMMMLEAALIALLFLILSRSAAREDERMGIRFYGEGVKQRDQS